MVQMSGSIIGRSLQNRLVNVAVLRLLRYLPSETTQQWIMDILLLVRSSRKTWHRSRLSLDDWQSSLFHLVSETVEELCAVDAIERQMELNRIDGCARKGNVGES